MKELKKIKIKIILNLAVINHALLFSRPICIGLLFATGINISYLY